MTDPNATTSIPDDIARAAAELVASGRPDEAVRLLATEAGISEDTARRVLAAATAEDDDLPPDVIAAAERGERILAIKLLRGSRELSLKEAKDLVDARCPAPAGSGCASAFLVAASMLSVVVCLTFVMLLPIGCASKPSDRPMVGDGVDPAARLRVATYNIRHGVGTDNVLDLDRTAAAIAALGADIVCLQEVDEKTRRCRGVDQAAWLGKALGMHHAFGSFMDYDGGRYGMAILSRWSIDSIDAWRLPTGNEPRMALAIDVSPPGIGPLTIIDVHFDWVDDDGYRFAQAEAVAARLTSLDHPWLVLGDFNDTPGSRTRSLFASLGVEGRKPAGSTKTWPAEIPTSDIDSIVAGPAGFWESFEAEVVAEVVASDHRPVVATVAMTVTPRDD